MGTIKTTNIQTITGSGTLTLGTSGETITIPSGVTATNFVAGVSSSSTSGTAISIDSSNRISMPNQPAFFATSNASDQLISVNTVGDFGITEVNIGNHYNTSTKQFTAPVSGTYYMEAVFQISGASATQRHALGVRLRKNGTMHKDQYHGNLGGISQYVTVNCTCVMDLSAGDTVDAMVTPGTAINVEYSGGKNRCHFAGYLIG